MCVEPLVHPACSSVNVACVPLSCWSFRCKRCMRVEPLVHPRWYFGECYMCTSEPLVHSLQAMHVCRTPGSPRLYLGERYMSTSDPLVIPLRGMHVCRVAGSSPLVPPSRWSFRCEWCVESLVHHRLYLGERFMCTSEPLAIPLQTMHVCRTAGLPRLYRGECDMFTSDPLVIPLRAMHVC